MSSSITWGGETLRVTRELLTRDYYDWVVNISPNLLGDDGLDVTGMASLLLWCTDFLDVDIEKLTELSTVEAGDGVIISVLVGRILNAGCPRWESVATSMEMSFSVRNYRPSSARVCDCRACSGALDDDGAPVLVDPLCLYESAGVDRIDRMISGIYPELMSEMWERPYYLYRLAVHERVCRSLSDHKRSNKSRGGHTHVGESSVDDVRAAQIARLKKSIKR